MLLDDQLNVIIGEECLGAPPVCMVTVFPVLLLGAKEGNGKWDWESVQTSNMTRGEV